MLEWAASWASKKALDAAWSRISNWWCEDKQRGILILGAGGVGKTTGEGRFVRVGVEAVEGAALVREVIREKPRGHRHADPRVRRADDVDEGAPPHRRPQAHRPRARPGRHRPGRDRGPRLQARERHRQGGLRRPRATPPRRHPQPRRPRRPDSAGNGRRATHPPKSRLRYVRERAPPSVFRQAN